MRDQMKIGDLAFFYHSNCKVPGIAGIMEVRLTPCNLVNCLDLAYLEERKANIALQSPRLLLALNLSTLKPIVHKNIYTVYIYIQYHIFFIINIR